ncbi:MAG TPA: hydrogenase maturation protease [Vicinamibacteria bacterium]
MSPSVVIGVGNPYRGDDGAGLEVARLLRQSPPPGTLVLERPGSGDDLMEAWRGARHVVIVDAASGAEPGSVRRFEAHEGPLPAAGLRTSTHSFGLGEAVETARTLGELPPVVVVYAIFGRSFEVGSRGLSPEVRRAAEAVAETLQSEIPGL